MNNVLGWFIPLASLVGGIFGAWVGIRVHIVKLETKMEMAEKRLEILQKRTHRYANDLLIHDMEIERALVKLDIPRVRRQNVEE